MYAGAPLALGALRHQKPDAPGRTGFRGEPCSPPSPNKFIIHWSGWEVDWKLYVAVLLGYGLDLVVAAWSLTIYYSALHLRPPDEKFDAHVEETYAVEN